MTVKQFELIEFYSNAIVSFSVVQTFALIYFVSDSNNFMEELAQRRAVSFITFLVVLCILLGMTLSVIKFKNMVVKHKIPEIEADLISNIYIGKVVATVVFGLPAVVIFFYKSFW